jgi:hypothetical protein
MAPRRRTIVLGTATVLLGLAALAASTVAMLTQTERGRAMIMRAVMPTLISRLIRWRFANPTAGPLSTRGRSASRTTRETCWIVVWSSSHLRCRVCA